MAGSVLAGVIIAFYCANNNCFFIVLRQHAPRPPLIAGNFASKNEFSGISSSSPAVSCIKMLGRCPNGRGWGRADLLLRCASTRCFLIPTQCVLRKLVWCKILWILKNNERKTESAYRGCAGRSHLGGEKSSEGSKVTGRSHDFLPVQFNCWKFQQQCEIVFFHISKALSQNYRVYSRCESDVLPSKIRKQRFTR